MAVPGDGRAAGPLAAQPGGTNLADILERVLDKGVVVAGDIRINLLDIELLTIRVRLLVASVDKAREMGIDWWEHDPSLSSAARNSSVGSGSAGSSSVGSSASGRSHRELTEENERLRERLAALTEPEAPTPGRRTTPDPASGREETS